MFDGTSHFHVYINHDLKCIEVWHHTGTEGAEPPNESFTEYMGSYEPYSDEQELKVRNWAKRTNETEGPRAIIEVIGKEKGIDE
jgi:hypothetical protein